MINKFYTKVFKAGVKKYINLKKKSVEKIFNTI